jgi:1-phosphatidylinositol-4-phosphate 5-kinase
LPQPPGCNKPPHRTPPHHLAHEFKFKDYAPKIFHRLRQLFGIDSASYMLSVCGNYNYLEFMSNSKSGQFFFYTHDGEEGPKGPARAWVSGSLYVCMCGCV